MLLGAILLAIGLVYFFNLTNFQLGNRIQSTSSGKQEITIACQNEIAIPDIIDNINQLKEVIKPYF